MASIFSFRSFPLPPPYVGPVPYAYWRFDQINGGTSTPDNQPANHPLSVTASGAPAASIVGSGKVDSRIKLNGAAGGNRLSNSTIGSDSGATISSTWMICGWFNVTALDVGINPCILSGPGAGIRNYCYLQRLSASTYKVFMGGGFASEFYSSNIYNIGEWHFFCNRSRDGFHNLSIDGDAFNTFGAASTSAQLDFGYDQGFGGNSFFNGYLDELYFFNVAMTDADRLQIYERTAAGFSIV